MNGSHIPNTITVISQLLQRHDLQYIITQLSYWAGAYIYNIYLLNNVTQVNYGWLCSFHSPKDGQISLFPV